MDVLIEVKFDDAHKRYVLTRGKDGYTPAIIFAPELQAWTFDLHNAHLLSNPELLPTHAAQRGVDDPVGRP